MRLITTIAQILAAMLDSLFAFVRDVFDTRSPADSIDRETAAVEAETARVLAEPDPDPVAIVRDAALGEIGRGYGRLPASVRARAACAQHAGVDLSRADDRQIRRWAWGEEEHPAVPRAWVRRARAGIVEPQAQRNPEVDNVNQTAAPEFC